MAGLGGGLSWRTGAFASSPGPAAVRPRRKRAPGRARRGKCGDGRERQLGFFGRADLHLRQSFGDRSMFRSSRLSVGLEIKPGPNRASPARRRQAC
jgi:hypothetical protein